MPADNLQKHSKVELVMKVFQINQSSVAELMKKSKDELMQTIRAAAADAEQKLSDLANLERESQSAAQRAVADAAMHPDADLAIEAHVPAELKTPSQPGPAKFIFPISLPGLKTFTGCDAMPAHSEHVPRDVEEEISVDRPAHPVTKSRLCLLCHDRFHGSGHKACQHRNPSLCVQLAMLNTSFQEQLNRGAGAFVCFFRVYSGADLLCLLCCWAQFVRNGIPC